MTTRARSVGCFKPPRGTYNGLMTSERANAYGRVVATIEEIGASKLQASEIERIRQAADTLLFSESFDAPGARESIEDIEDLTRHLAESERWTDERAERLFDDVAECGPVVPA
jgi:hypothetical protein